MKNVRLVSQIAKIICWGFLLGLPCMYLVILFWPETTQSLLLPAINQPLQLETIESWQWNLVLALILIPLSISWWGIFRLTQLFNSFINQQYFDKTCINNLKQFSLALILKVVTSTIGYTLAVIILSINHASGSKILSIKIGSGEISTFFIAMVFWVISWVFTQAASLEAENKQFI